MQLNKTLLFAILASLTAAQAAGLGAAYYGNEMVNGEPEVRDDATEDNRSIWDKIVNWLYTSDDDPKTATTDTASATKT